MELDAGRREAQAALAAYGLTVAGCMLFGLFGYRLTIPFAYYQLLGADHLRERLAESLLYLHSQPPLLNLGLGTALKLSAWLGVAPQTLLLLGHIALGALGIWAFVRLAQRLVKTAWIRWVCIGFVVLHPALYMALFHYFYTLHELVLLCLIPLAAMASLETRRLAPYALLCGEVLALVYTHSLFHWVFGAAILAGVAWPILRNAATRGHLVCLGVALVVLLAWPAKNWLLLDEFQYSTWAGYSLALELPIPAERVPTRRWEVPERFRGIPVLAEREKQDGSKNWNHYSMIGRAHELGALARATLREDPTALLDKAQLNYWNYTRFSARHPYTGRFGTGDFVSPGNPGPGGQQLPGVARAWLSAYELIFYLDPRSSDALAHRAYRTPRTDGTGRTPNTQSWALSGFVFAFPLLIACALLALYRRWSLLEPSERVGVSLLLAILLWVLAATLLIDGSEANRIRFPTEPYLPLLCGWLFASRAPTSQRKPELDVT